MKTERAQVAIVGAGPAGIAAALAAGEAGADVLVVDENPRAGGQIFRQGIEGAAPDRHELLHPPSHARGDELLARVRQSNLRRLPAATVFAAAPGSLEVECRGEALAVRYERLVLCTGACDRVVPFPGWTLPGVLTAGAAQVLVRGYGVRPGARALVAGSGPLLLPAITSLVAAGCEVVAALESQPRWRLLRALPAVLLEGKRRREAAFYARMLRRHRVALRFGWTVRAAHAEHGELRAATIVRVRADGSPVAASARRLDVDLVCTGFGLVPAVELASLLGCAIDWNPVRGGWCVRHDPTMQTTLPGVYVAGETAGIGGADVAVAEGRLAGLAAAGAGDLVAAQRAARRERRCSDLLLSAFRPQPGLADLAEPDTLLCRCEDVTRAQVEDAAHLFGKDLRSVKMGTRAGMGPCQGRICAPIVDDLLARLCSTARRSCPNAQVPVKPVALDTMTTSDPS